MKIVYRAENIVDANLVKAALEQAGVDAYITGEYLTGVVGELPAWDIVKVMVAESDVERAAPVVESVDRDLREHRRADPSEAAPDGKPVLT